MPNLTYNNDPLFQQLVALATPIEYNPEWANLIGYFDHACDAVRGMFYHNLYTCKDEHNRTVLISQGQLLAQRYAADDSPLIGHDFRDLVKAGNAYKSKEILTRLAGLFLNYDPTPFLLDEEEQAIIDTIRRDGGFIDNHQKTGEIQPIKTIAVYRSQDTRLRHRAAVVPVYAGGFCINPFYLRDDGQVALSTSSIGPTCKGITKEELEVGLAKPTTACQLHLIHI